MTPVNKQIQAMPAKTNRRRADPTTNMHSKTSQTTSNISNSTSSTSSCKSISEPSVLLATALADLRRASHFHNDNNGKSENEGNNGGDDHGDYWDCWIYWKRHPFVRESPDIYGQILLEHLLIITNTLDNPRSTCNLSDEMRTLHGDVDDFLELLHKSEDDKNEQFTLCAQVTTAFYLFYAEKVVGWRAALNLLEKSKMKVPMEQYNSIKAELMRNGTESDATLSTFPSFFTGSSAPLTWLNRVSGELTTLIERKLGWIYRIIRNNPASFTVLVGLLVTLVLRKFASTRLLQ